MAGAMYYDATEHDRLLDNATFSEQPHASSTEARKSARRESVGEQPWLAIEMVLKIGSTMFDFFSSGCAMAALGIEHQYHTSDGVTAFIFPAGTAGYLIAAASVGPASRRFGRRGIAVASPVIRLIGALMLAAQPSFAAVLVAYVCFGLGTGLTDTAWNSWASSTRRPNVLQGLLHGSFSLGCIAGPIIAVAVLRRQSWNAFYVIIAGLAVVELVVQGWAFRHDTPLALHSLGADSQTPATVLKRGSLLRRPSIWICGAFYVAYQGVEATFTGWIVVFMLRVRNADPTVAGLSSSTFWLGMAVGRYTLGLVTERYGVSGTVAIYIALALGLQVMLNLVKDISFTMVLLAANGFFVAPLFPSGIVLLVSRLRAEENLSAVALLIALGQVGGSLATLAVGFMADSLGIRHLFEMMCGLSAVMLAVWATLVLVT